MTVCARRWFAQRYPRAIKDVVEEDWIEVNGELVPPDTTRANPNGIEFDALYLDMNGIIHNCIGVINDEGLTEEDMMMRVFAYISRLFDIIKPRRLFYMALDGVAPRAKMNQQRARRFRSANEAR